MRLIALFLFLLLPPSYAGQVFSSLEAVENKNTTLISNAAGSDEKIIETVTANGYGTSVDAAAQNAAENALTQVVGSFIDSETLIKKKKEIQDGVISRTKVIKKDIRDYSQGSIKSFEVLNVQENGSIYIVTARVDVRVEDFRAYIKELAYESKKINQGLFSSIKTDEENIENKLDLLGKIIDPLINAEVIDINIGTPERLEELSAFGCKFYKINNIISNCDRNLNEYNNDSRTINTTSFASKGSLVIPITFDIKKDYLDNAINILDNISDTKQSKVGKYDTRIDSQIFSYDRDYMLNIVYTKSGNYTRYILPETRTYNKRRAQGNTIPILYDYQRCITSYPQLRLQFLNSKKESVWQKDFHSCANHQEKTMSDSSMKIKIAFLGTGDGWLQTYGNLHGYQEESLHTTISDQSRMLLIVEPSNELMNSIQEISLQYIQK